MLGCGSFEQEHRNICLHHQGLFIHIQQSQCYYNITFFDRHSELKFFQFSIHLNSFCPRNLFGSQMTLVALGLQFETATEPFIVFHDLGLFHCFLMIRVRPCILGRNVFKKVMLCPQHTALVTQC